MDIKNTLLKLKAAGLTQTKIADAIGCKQPTVSELMAEKIGLARPSNKIVQGLTALAAQYDIDTGPHGAAQPNPKKPLHRATRKLVSGAPIDGKKVREAKGGVRKVQTDTRKVRA